MKSSSRTAGARLQNRHRNREYILKTSLAVFVCLVLLVPSSVSVFHQTSTGVAYAQQEAASTTSIPTSGAASNPDTTVFPQSLRVTDSAMGDAQLPLRASIVNNEPVGELANASKDKGELGEYFPIVAFHFDKKPIGFEEGSTIVKHVLVGPIKSYDSADSVLGEANYWKDIPLDKKVALETDRAGLHYFIASVQFANGTSGIYSGMMEVNAIGIKPSTSDESIQFQLGPESIASGVVKVDQADMKASESDPVFQQIASRIICSDLSNNGFEVCEEGNEEEVLENNNSDEETREANDDEDEEVEVRGDGGKGGRYDVNNCTGEQCEDADRETQEEEEGDYCEIDPGYCEDKNEDNDNSDNDNDEEDDNSNDNGDTGNDEAESEDREQNENTNG